MNKHPEPLFQKRTFSPPGRINFANIFITPPKTFQFDLGVAGKEILTLSALYRSCQFLPLSDRTKWRDSLSSISIGQKKQLTGQNLHNEMRNVTCVGTQTSKVPTRVTLLFINYSVLYSNPGRLQTDNNFSV